MASNSNICKFVTQNNTSYLVTKNFVYEQDQYVIERITSRKNHTIHLVCSGEGVFSSDFVRPTPLKPGTIFFTFAGFDFHIQSLNNLEFMFIAFEGARSGELFRRFNISASNCVFPGFENLVSFWESSLSKAYKSNLDLVSESVLLYTFSEMNSNVSSHANLEEKILRYMDANFNDSSLTLEIAAKDLNYNPKYISRIFREKTGISFSEHLKNLRVQQAVFLIEQGVTSIKNVSFLSGYNDPFYFSKVFKEKLGMSPSDFIKKKQNKQAQE